MPFAATDPGNPCVTERDAVRRPGHQVTSLAEGVVPWVEGRIALYLRCLRLSIRYCSELIRQFRHGMAHVVRERADGHHPVLDGSMLDTRDYVSFVKPVWRLESVQDSPGTSDAVRWQLHAAAAVNARATDTLFPRRAGKPAR